MLLLKLVISSIAAIVSCSASGIGHFVPAAAAVRTVPIVRYAPFYSFTGAVRSIHAVAPALRAIAPAVPVPAVASAPFIPAPLSAPIHPASAFPAPGFPAPAFPAPAFPAPAFPAPAFQAPAFSAPVLPAPPALAPAYPAVHSAPLFNPYLPKFAPGIHALPAAPLIRAVPAPPVFPYASYVKSFAPAFPAPVFAPAPVSAPIAVARTLPYNVQPYPQPLVPAPVVRQA